MKYITAAIVAVSVGASPAIAQLAEYRYAQLHHATAQLDQLNMDAMPHLDQDGVRQVQQSLLARGFDPGAIDGILGPRTRHAVTSFQERYGIESRGDVDNQTLFALGHVELAIEPAGAGNTAESTSP